MYVICDIPDEIDEHVCMNVIHVFMCYICVLVSFGGLHIQY